MAFLLPPVPADPLWAVMAAYEADTRPHKIDLGIGVYRDNTGHTPVLQAVQAVEQQLAEQAVPKTYRPLSGNAAFNVAMTELLFGVGHPAVPRTVTQQTVGGSGALRLLAEFIATTRPQATVWLSDPGYINHQPTMQAAGLRVADYPWRAVATAPGELDVAAMGHALEGAHPQDVLLIQGCCHNPSGLDPSAADWDTIGRICRDRGLLPFVDMAYQGLGNGLEADAVGLRMLANQVDALVVAASCSKNMGLYCERTGTASVIAHRPQELPAIRAVLQAIARTDYGVAPNHGAAIATLLLAQPQTWHAELDTMRQRIRNVRQALAQALAAQGATELVPCIAQRQGMFSTLPLTAKAMMQLQTEHAIYGTPQCRINVAGLTLDQVPRVAAALHQVQYPASA